MTGTSKNLAVVNCGQLVTLAGPARARKGKELEEISIVADGVMLTREGKVEWVGPASEVTRARLVGRQIIDAGKRVVLPGFVDAHTHPIFAGTRVEEYALRAKGATYEQIAASGGGIRSTVRKTREATEEQLTEVARHYSQWFFRCGTTTIEAKSGYGLSVEDELKLLRVIRSLHSRGPLRYVATFLGAHEIPDEHRARPSAYVDLIVHEMIPQVARHGLAEYCDVFCEPSVFDLAISRKILEAGRRAGFGIRVHANQLSRSGAAGMAAELGAATADHLERVDAEGIRALALAGVQPILLPASVYTLGSKRFAPARAMIEAGLAVVLATDFNPGSSPTPSIPFVLSLASTQMGMSLAEAITATTINAAYSLGRGSLIGSLEPGKRADFVIHECKDFREIAYFVGVESARCVCIGGDLVFDRTATG